MVVKDFVPNSFKIFLQNLIDSAGFEWYYNGNSTTEGQDNIFQFIHVIVNEQGYQSPHYEKIKPLLYFFELHTGLKVKGILRMKANLLTQRELSEDTNKLAIHTDVNINGAKQCALIALEEIFTNNTDESKHNFWIEVKQEIEKL